MLMVAGGHATGTEIVRPMLPDVQGSVEVQARQQYKPLTRGTDAYGLQDLVLSFLHYPLGWQELQMRREGTGLASTMAGGTSTSGGGISSSFIAYTPSYALSSSVSALTAGVGASASTTAKCS